MKKFFSIWEILTKNKFYRYESRCIMCQIVKTVVLSILVINCRQDRPLRQLRVGGQGFCYGVSWTPDMSYHRGVILKSFFSVAQPQHMEATQPSKAHVTYKNATPSWEVEEVHIPAAVRFFKFIL